MVPIIRPQHQTIIFIVENEMQFMLYSKFLHICVEVKPSLIIRVLYQIFSQSLGL